MYCRTSFGSFFVLSTDEGGSSFGKRMLRRLTRSVRAHASSSSFHDFRFVILVCIPNAVPNSYGCDCQVNGDRSRSFYLSSASRSCFVRAYSLTCFFWKGVALRGTSSLTVAHSFVGVLLVQFVDTLGDFVIFLATNGSTSSSASPNRLTCKARIRSVFVTSLPSNR